MGIGRLLHFSSGARTLSAPLLKEEKMGLLEDMRSVRILAHMLDAFVDGMTPLDREATTHIIAELRAIGERLEKAAEAMEQ